MSAPVTSLSDIVILAHQQYGSRFQVNQQQLVNFCNMIQYIAYNKDLEYLMEWDQIFILGQDTFLETDTSYVAPIEADVLKDVTGTTSGVIGKLMNFNTENRVNRWIIEPPDGGPDFILTAGETLTIVGGSAATGVVCQNQDFEVSSGPYRVPTAAAGNPPFRKLYGITSLDDKQLFHIPPQSSFDGFDDYGQFLNDRPGRRSFFPYRKDIFNVTKQVTLITSSPPEILQTEETCGPGGTTLNTSKLRWVYWRNPPAITSITDEANLIIPEEYRYEILYKGISKLGDVATYGDYESVRQMIEPICERFWVQT